MSLLVLSTSVCELVPDLLEDSNGPQREVFVHCDLPIWSAPSWSLIEITH
jgi:hypothetical protein